MSDTTIEFKRLTGVDRSDIITQMNPALVRRHRPLTGDHFGRADGEAFFAAKEKLWAEHGDGPRAFMIDGRFAGWGGLPLEGGDADLALVLHPNHRGAGQALAGEILRRAFVEKGFESVPLRLPASRTRIKASLWLGVRPDGEAQVADKRFLRYRLTAIRIQ
jgi:[ribosomal protein S5]-alanine N-acetyltransferase